jgi:cytochrome c-type biogenesis protein CcmE
VDVSEPRTPLGGHDEEESLDAAPLRDAGSRLDVTPRTHRDDGRGAQPTRRLLAIAGVVVLLGALGLVVFNGLNDAALFYYNVDEALEQRDELGDQRFRMQGNVIDGTIEQVDGGVEFVLAFADAEVPVHHRGDPPELFSSDIPVILEGQFDDVGFASDEILIRHDNTYTEEHEDRLDRARDDVEARERSEG